MTDEELYNHQLNDAEDILGELKSKLAYGEEMNISEFIEYLCLKLAIDADRARSLTRVLLARDKIRLGKGLGLKVNW